MSPLFLLLMLPGPRADELTAGSTGDYATISEALSAAGSGDTISVQPGTYSELLWIGTNVVIQAEQGLGTVFLAGDGSSTPIVRMYAGTMSQVIIQDAAEVAVNLWGGAKLERSIVVAPGTVGVLVDGGLPQVTEVSVQDAGTYGFHVDDSTPTLRRCLAIDAGSSGFLLSSTGSYDNLVSLGGTHGFEITTEIDLHHPAALDSSGAGILGSSPASVLYALLLSNPLVADCQSNDVEVAWSLLWETADVQDCPGNPFHDNLIEPPQLTAWTEGGRPPQVDLRPQDDSSMVDAAQGTDATDGTTADIGPFGGEHGIWTDADGDGVPIFFDCDDGDASVHLHASERADGVDNDCDGETDEGTDTGQPDDTGIEGDTRDIDGDGTSQAGGDCEDHNVATWPGAVELADGADNDCDGVVDEGTWYFDDDGDGYTELAGDCDDGDPERNPGTTEQGEDGVDHDCDGVADGTPTSDSDADGWTIGEGDCDDTRAGVHPGAWDGLDGLDGDCDGVTDEDGLAFDGDADGVTFGEMDCNDGDLSISSSSPEAADDGIDQDCDGVDLYDVDQDGHASPEAGGEDCDDERSDTYPDASELCDGLDNDCDGTIDEHCGQGDLDGPEQQEWSSGIHGACNCSALPRHAPGWPFGALVLGAMAWLGCRRRAHRG